MLPDEDREILCECCIIEKIPKFIRDAIYHWILGCKIPPIIQVPPSIALWYLRRRELEEWNGFASAKKIKDLWNVFGSNSAICEILFDPAICCFGPNPVAACSELENS